MSILRVVSVSDNPNVRAALGNDGTFTIECADDRGCGKAVVCMSVDDRGAVVREWRDGRDGQMEERRMRFDEKAQIRYGVGSEQCGDTPVLPLQEALRLLAADPDIFKVIFTLEDEQQNEVWLILREYGTTWLLYGFSPGCDYFSVIPGMPTEEEVSRLD